MDKGEFNGHRLYTELSLDYRLRLWAPTSAVSELSNVIRSIVLSSLN